MKNLKIPLVSTMIIGIAASFFMPYTPVDETRYVSVAWEMQNTGSYVLPMLNGEPYAHKPPLLFWLIQAGWKLFGVNEATPRLIPMLFGLLSIVLVYKISLRLWPKEEKTAACTALVLGSSVIWLLWSCAIMFDTILTFWILLAVTGILLAENNDAPKKSWSLLALSTAGGLLTKGPIVLVYILPLIVLHPLWSTERPTRWKIRMFTALLAGFGLAMLWAIPASIQGGKEYCLAIFWKQSAGRISSSFAHQRSFWWYLPFLPVVFFPWSLFRPSFSKFRFRSADPGTRLALLWLVAPLMILSLISGKQIHYLIPLIPAGALLIGRNIARAEKTSGSISVKVIGTFYLLLGLMALALPFMKLGSDIGLLEHGSTRFAAAGLISAGLALLILPFRAINHSAKWIALSALLALGFTLFKANSYCLKNYDIKNLSVLIKTKIDEGRIVANAGEYHGQYQFLGRLTNSLQVIHKDDAALIRFFIGNPDGLLISYIKESVTPENAIIYWRQKYKGKTVVLWGSKPCSSEKENDL